MKILVKILLKVLAPAEQLSVKLWVFISHVGGFWDNYFFFLITKHTIFTKHNVVTAWMLMSAYTTGILYAAAIISIIICAYLFSNIHRWRRARVFVSYQHLSEDLAIDIFERLRMYHIKPIMLPFRENVEHDLLLDDVKTNIARSDAVVCIPGETPSFVENEVAMAFALEKPLFFVTRSDHLSRIPNTAKKGYPIVNLNVLDEGGWASFCKFCLYICGYNIALLHLCFCVLRSFIKISVLLILGYALMFLVILWMVDKNVIQQRIELVEYLITAITVVFFVLPYALFTNARMTVARKLRRFIGGQNFTLEAVPRSLTYKLRKSEVNDILFKGNILADHEIKKYNCEQVGIRLNDECDLLASHADLVHRRAAVTAITERMILPPLRLPADAAGIRA
jgi:hypothetical protein